MLFNYFLLFVLITSTITQSTAFEPLSSFTVGVTFLGGIATNLIGSLLYCNYKECCDEPWTTGNITNLTQSLNERVYGQHLVQNSVPNLIRGHLTNESPRKPLVISFHGWTGTGKTWVSKLIAENLFKKGLNSKYVVFIPVPLWFRDPSKTREQSEKLHHTIESTLARCKHSLFIFDDIKSMNPQLLDELLPYLNYPPPMDGIDYTRAIYILLSNAGATKINDFTVDQFRDGRDRSSIRMNEMHNIISDAIHREDGAFKDTELVSRQVIDASIPFLPLEKAHVRKCIERAIIDRGSIPIDSLVEKVLKDIRFVPEDLERFSESGCKRLDEIITDFI
ncbi:Torsin-1A-like [Oopsacas minuta]|uniref:Torsin-1A-like n=1 Tax=Oopsacas minuta TaxID=111878 RepID=A0AAV7KCD5_9METZ|nr:Torsin-1A-like [Oopsacas minuta]